MKKFKSINLNKKIFFILASLIIILLINYFVFSDSIIAICSALLSLTYIFLAGKGNFYCYLFGLSGSGLYCYLAFTNAFWGNLLLYLLYYIPMQIIGFFKWKKNLKSNKNEIIKTYLDKKEKYKLLISAIIATFLLINLLSFMKDSNPFIDGTVTIFSIIGMYLTVKRCIEQWIAWMIVNFLSAIMWLERVLQGEKVYSTVLLWIISFFLAIYFYKTWKKEI